MLFQQQWLLFLHNITLIHCVSLSLLVEILELYRQHIRVVFPQNICFEIKLVVIL
jgi:hypothetical protein